LSSPAQAGDPVAAGFDPGKKSGAELITCTCSPIGRNKLLGASRITASSSVTWTIGALAFARSDGEGRRLLTLASLAASDLAPYRHVGSNFETDY
jgi:hypothetical protein